MYRINYNGNKIALSDECSEELVKVCVGLAKNATGNWRENRFDIRIYEEDGIINTSTHGLSKVYRTNKIPFEDIMDEGNRNEYAFYKALYNFISGLNAQGIVPDEISLEFIPGREQIVGDLMDGKRQFGKHKINSLEAVNW